MRFDCPHSQVPAATRVLVASITMFVVLAALSLAPRVLTDGEAYKAIRLELLKRGGKPPGKGEKLVINAAIVE